MENLDSRIARLEGADLHNRILRLEESASSMREILARLELMEKKIEFLETDIRNMLQFQNKILGILSIVIPLINFIVLYLFKKFS